MTLNNEITARTGSKDDLVTLHVDTVGFAKKPGNKGEGKVWKVVTRTSNNTSILTKEQFLDMIGSGHSFIPGLCDNSDLNENEGVKQNDWLQQDLFFLDFDNEDKKNKKGEVIKEIEYISLVDAVEKMKAFGVNVFVAYKTFSNGKVVNGKAIEKYRLGFAATRTITEIDLRDKFQAILMGLMESHIDESCKNRNRYFNGTTKEQIVYVDYEALVDAQWLIDTYWDDSFSSFIPGYVKTPGSKTKRKKKVSSDSVVKKSSERCAKSYGLTAVEDFPDEHPTVKDWRIKYNMQHHYEEYMELVDLSLKENVYVEGTGRRDIVFDVFNMTSFQKGTREAYAVCLEINERFEESLTNKEFNDCTWGALNHIETNCEFLHESQYIYRYDTLLDKLGISEEVKEGLAYFKNKRAKKDADYMRPLKKERDKVIKGLYEEGKSSRQIAKALEEMYGKGSKLAISDRAIRKFIKKECKKVGTFGTITFFSSSISFSGNIQSDLEENKELLEESDLRFLDELETEREEHYPTLNERQNRAYMDALEGHNLIISSNGGGTGKSFLIDRTRAGLEAQGKVVAVCAPTAVAANNVGGVTVHSAFMMSTKDNEITNRMLYSVKNYDTVIIDEAGMLAAKDFKFVCKLIEEVKQQFDKMIQIVLVCDVLQLPPVEDAYFFQTDYYRSIGFRIHYLTENIRQQGDKLYLNLLNKVRIGEDKIGTAEVLNRILQHDEDIHSIYLVAYRDDAERINRQCLKRIPGGVIDLGNVKVKIGAKVICIKNNSRAGYFNGMRGVVESVGKNCVMVRTNNGILVTVRKQTIVTDKRTYQGYPLALGYAVTIHKAQGMTLDSANIDPRAFADGQLYVALSRVKTAAGVHLLCDIEPDFIMVNEDALVFDEELRLQCGIETVVEEVEYENERE